MCNLWESGRPPQTSAPAGRAGRDCCSRLPNRWRRFAHPGAGRKCKESRGLWVRLVVPTERVRQSSACRNRSDTAWTSSTTGSRILPLRPGGTPGPATAMRQPPVNRNAIARAMCDLWESVRPPARKRARRARGHGERTAGEGTAGKRIGGSGQGTRRDGGMSGSGRSRKRRCERRSLRRAPPAGAWSRPAKPWRRQLPVNLNAIARAMCNLWESVRPPPRERARRARGEGNRRRGKGQQGNA